MVGELPELAAEAQPPRLCLCWLPWLLLKLWNGASTSVERSLGAPCLLGPSAWISLVDSGERTETWKLDR